MQEWRSREQKLCLGGHPITYHQIMGDGTTVYPLIGKPKKFIDIQICQIQDTLTCLYPQAHLQKGLFASSAPWMDCISILCLHPRGSCRELYSWDPNHGEQKLDEVGHLDKNLARTSSAVFSTDPPHTIQIRPARLLDTVPSILHTSFAWIVRANKLRPP